MNYNDPRGAAEAGHDIFQYLVNRLCQALQGRSKIGQCGWQWWNEQQRGFVCTKRVLAWCDGCTQSSQLSNEMPLRGQWWPMIVVDLPGEEVLPSYCPALAYNKSRPWGIKRCWCRLFHLPGQVPPPPIHGSLVGSMPPAQPSITLTSQPSTPPAEPSTQPSTTSQEVDGEAQSNSEDELDQMD